MNALTLGERKNDGSMLVPQEYRVVTEGLVNVFITSNCNSFTSEKKFSKDITIADLKNKLELITGASALSMTLTAFDKKDSKVCELSDGNALLGSFPVDSGMRIHVEDLKYRGEFEDPTVKKFELTPDDYSKRDNTVQSYLKRNKMGKYNEEEMKALAEAKEKEEKAEEEAAGKMKEGDRCQVTVPGNMSRRGTVRFVGKVHFKPGMHQNVHSSETIATTFFFVIGFWVGVQYDEPLGKNDGSKDGQRYFTCPDKYGGFVRVAHVEVGDFPEEDLGLSDDEM